MTSPGLVEGIGIAPRMRASSQLRELIAIGGFRSGTRLPPEQHLAEQFNVARSTLRLSLKELEEEGLLRTEGRFRIVADLGSDQRTLLSDTIVILGDAPDPPEATRLRAASGWGKIIETGAIEAIGGASLHAMILNADLVAGDRVRRLIDERPLGVVVVRHAILTPAGVKILQALIAGGLRVVGYGTASEFSGIDSVASDHCQGSYELTRWLISQGRRRILRVWSGAGAQSPRPVWVDHRDQGYERAMSEAGLEIIPPLIVPLMNLGYSSDQLMFEAQFTATSGFLFKHLCGDKPVDAMMAIADGFVPQIAAACKMFGKRPNEDVAIVGYDNIWSDVRERRWEATAPLASVDKCNAQIGRELIDLLRARIARSIPDEPQHRIVKPKLIVHDETLAD